MGGLFFMRGKESRGGWCRLRMTHKRDVCDL